MASHNGLVSLNIMLQVSGRSVVETQKEGITMQRLLHYQEKPKKTELYDISERGTLEVKISPSHRYVMQ